VSNRRIDDHIRWYAKHPKHLQRVEARARPYLYYIVEQIEKRDMPMELALLPVVESAFQPFAYSPGRAAGLWQFIPGTGRMYGLKQNWWYDGRRDVVAATNAALDYLQSLAGQFDGDWELALASYNTGAGNVRRAIRKNKKLGKPTDFWSLDLPRETEGYVPRLLAVARVIADPATYGISLAEMPNQPYFGAVAIESQLDLAKAAEMAGVRVEELYRLNPGFNRWATDPEGPHRIYLPLDRIDSFEQQLARLDPQQRLRWKRYKIRSGDNLGSIAKKYDTTVDVLKQVNRLTSHRIRAGRHLLIPLASQRPERYALSAGQRKIQLQKRKRSGIKVTHRVATGDTLWDISRSYKVNYKDLARWNGISPRDPLKLGQKLVVWTAKPANRTKRVTAPDTSALINTQSVLSYRVRKGDSLARIATRFNVTVADLRRWNSLPGRYLQPGQKLKLYLDVAEQTR